MNIKRNKRNYKLHKISGQRNTRIVYRINRNNLKGAIKMEMIIDSKIDRAVDEAFERLKNTPSILMKKDGHLMFRKRRSGKSMRETYLEDKYDSIE